MPNADKRHEAWLRFIRDITNIAAGLSKEDLTEFRSVASQEHPAFANLVNEYLRLARRSDTDVQIRKRPATKPSLRRMHLFDLLREKTFFPQNSDLARFASRVVPDMRTYRFDKKSRGNIASRIIEYLEENDPRQRAALEESMREALAKLRDGPPSVENENERRSFLSKWEQIIRGTEF